MLEAAAHTACQGNPSDFPPSWLGLARRWPGPVNLSKPVLMRVLWQMMLAASATLVPQRQALSLSLVRNHSCPHQPLTMAPHSRKLVLCHTFVSFSEDDVVSVNGEDTSSSMDVDSARLKLAVAHACCGMLQTKAKAMLPPLLATWQADVENLITCALMHDYKSYHV